MPALKVIDDFAIVTTEIHNEFDDFKRNEVSQFNGLSMLPVIELLQFWSILAEVSPASVLKYGKNYFLLKPRQLDDLSDWVGEMRIKFMSLGQAIFEDRGSNDRPSPNENTSANESVSLKYDSYSCITLKILQWVKYLDLYFSDKIAIETNCMLNDKHMYAALKLLKKQFPEIDGFQPTILCQTNGFSPVTKNGKRCLVYS